MPRSGNVALVRQYSDHDSVAVQVDIVKKIKKLLGSRDPKVIEAVKKANQGLLNCKVLTPGAVHTDQVLTNLSIRYSNPTFVGLGLMPVLNVNKPGGKFYKYSKRDRLGAPDASVGLRSQPNEISETRTLASYATEPYALIDFLDDRLARMQDAPLDEMSEMVAALNDVHDLLEEERIALAATTAANFAGNTTDLTGSDRWDDPGSDPISQIHTALDGMWSAPGANLIRAVTTPEVWRSLQRHPSVLEQFKYSGSSLPTPQQLAQFLGLNDILIAEARKDTANESQTAVYDRVWGKNFVIAKVNPSPGLRSATFGITFRWGQKMTSQWYDPMPGVSGGYYAKVGLEETHDIIAGDLAYLYTNVIS